MIKHTLIARSNKGKNRIATIQNLFPDWDGTWNSLIVSEHQLFIVPDVPEPERFSRWVETSNDPNFTVLPHTKIK